MTGNKKSFRAVFEWLLWCSSVVMAGGKNSFTIWSSPWRKEIAIWQIPNHYFPRRRNARNESKKKKIHILRKTMKSFLPEIQKIVPIYILNLEFSVFVFSKRFDCWHVCPALYVKYNTWHIQVSIGVVAGWVIFCWLLGPRVPPIGKWLLNKAKFVVRCLWWPQWKTPRKSSVLWQPRVSSDKCIPQLQIRRAFCQIWRSERLNKSM